MIKLLVSRLLDKRAQCSLSGISIFCLLSSHDNCIINLQDLCFFLKMSKQNFGLI